MEQDLRTGAQVQLTFFALAFTVAEAGGESGCHARGLLARVLLPTWLPHFRNTRPGDQE